MVPRENEIRAVHLCSKISTEYSELMNTKIIRPVNWTDTCLARDHELTLIFFTFFWTESNHNIFLHFFLAGDHELTLLF